MMKSRKFCTVQSIFLKKKNSIKRKYLTYEGSEDKDSDKEEEGKKLQVPRNMWTYYGLMYYPQDINQTSKTEKEQVL